jgi:exopolysaccharide biosynthesis polyprenyl glycosylphosphotransferase
MKKSEIFFGLVRIPIDFAMIIFGFFIAYKLRALDDLIPFFNLPVTLETFPDFNSYLKFSSVSALVFLLFLATNKSYALRITTLISKEFKKIFVSAFVWFTTVMSYYFLTRTFPFSRLAIVYSIIFSVISVLLGRLLIRFIQNLFLKYNIGKRNILILGTNNISESLILYFRKGHKYNVFAPKKILYEYSYENLSKLVAKFAIEEIFQTESKIKDKTASDVLEFCRENHIQYHFVPDLLEVQKSNVDFFYAEEIPIMSLNPTSLDGWGRVMKRVFDFVVSVFAIILWSPILIITAIAIKIDSKGPILFTRLDNGEKVKRVGEKGELFSFYKFRSMHPNTHNLRYTILADQNTRNGSPMVKIKNDPRITRVGRFIRKYSIDEIPQLFNVLIGNLSLVGPRAHLPEEVARYDRHHKFVLTIKPGITGLAQISGRSDLDFEKEVKLDTYYIEHWSLFSDIKILIKTIFVVLKGEVED